jgi:hypothetical protein
MGIQNGIQHPDADAPEIAIQGFEIFGEFNARVLLLDSKRF